MSLADYRKAAGLTQEALARLALVARSSISYVESGGQRPSAKFALKVCRALSVAHKSHLEIWDVFPDHFNRVRYGGGAGGRRA